MKPRLLCPGPTPTPEDTLLELARPVTFHRSAQFRAVVKEVTEDLGKIFVTTQPVMTITASGTGAMEAAVSNLLTVGGKAICLISGRWGERWRNQCKAFGVTAIEVNVPHGEPVPPAALEKALADHPDATVVFSTLSETATGVRNDIQAYGAITRGRPQVLVVDGISGLGVMPCPMDEWGVDVMVTGSQKALMLPPGLAFVALSDKAWKVVDANYAAPNPPRTFYFDLHEEGLDKCHRRHARMALAARAAAAPLGLELLAKQPADGLTVYKVPPHVDGAAILGALEKEHGIRIAGGQDTLKGKILRLAHMGYIDFFEVLAAVAALEMTLPKFGHPVAPGSAVAACQKAYAESA